MKHRLAAAAAGRGRAKGVKVPYGRWTNQYFWLQPLQHPTVAQFRGFGGGAPEKKCRNCTSVSYFYFRNIDIAEGTDYSVYHRSIGAICLPGYNNTIYPDITKHK